MADQNESVPARIERLLDKRPPLPPEPADKEWTWTRQKLKAVYLEAFTQLNGKEIAEAMAIDRGTLWRWRKVPDYRRYLATLIAADGLADRAERVKARKALAKNLNDAIVKRMDHPRGLDGEKLSSLLRAQREMLDALQDDAEALRQIGDDQDAAARAGQARPAFDLVEKLALIKDPAEREVVKRHLLSMMGEYLDAPKVIDASPADASEVLEMTAGDGPSAAAEPVSLAESRAEAEPDPTPAEPVVRPPEPEKAEKQGQTIGLDEFFDP